jgi:hypothetical protein
VMARDGWEVAGVGDGSGFGGSSDKQAGLDSDMKESNYRSVEQYEQIAQAGGIAGWRWVRTADYRGWQLGVGAIWVGIGWLPGQGPCVD